MSEPSEPTTPTIPLREVTLSILAIPAQGEEPAVYTIMRRDTTGERPYRAVCVEAILPTATEAIHNLLAELGGEATHDIHDLTGTDPTPGGGAV